MYHIAVVDDEQQCCDQMVDFLTRYAAEQNLQFQISCYHSGMQFLENYSPTFQLVFLDIDMSSISANSGQAAEPSLPAPKQKITFCGR